MSKKGNAKSKAEVEKRKSGAALTLLSNAAPSGDMAERQFLLISKALADPTRMAVLRRIAQGEGACSSVRDCLGVSAATLSHHMKELEHAGIVSLSREGRFVHAKLDRKLWKRYVSELKSLAQ